MDDINKVLLDWNPWLEGDFPNELFGFRREIDLSKYLDFKEIKIVEGGRRVGKSTLIYQVIKNVLEQSKNVLYINFDDEVLKNYSLSEVYYSFLKIQKIDYLFVDEIQNCSSWVHFVRKMYDTQKIKQIFITGSNSSLIKKEYSNLLTGRTINVVVDPLTFKEFLSFKNVSYDVISSKKEVEIKNYFDEFIKYGGFPEVVKRNSSKKELLLNYFEDFLYKDIVNRYNVNSDKLRDLTIFLASNISKFISYRKVADSLGLNNLTVQDYISYLKEVYLIKEVYRFDFSLKKQFSAKKKPYFLDVGIANSISFKFSEDKGRLLENVVLNSLDNAYVFEDKYECDFLVKDGLRIVSAFQVCYLLDEDNKEREVNGLVEAMKIHSLKEGLLLTYDQEDKIVKDGKTILVKPVWKWLLE